MKSIKTKSLCGVVTGEGSLTKTQWVTDDVVIGRSTFCVSDAISDTCLMCDVIDVGGTIVHAPRADRQWDDW